MNKRFIILISLAFCFWLLNLLSFRSLSGDEHYISLINNKVEKTLDNHQLILNELLDLSIEDLDSVDIPSDDVYIRVYDNGSLVYWNNASYLPEYSTIKSKDSIFALEKEGKWYLVSNKKKIYNRKNLLEYFAITSLKESYNVNNKYLGTFYNPDIFPDVPISIQGDPKNISYNEQPIFGISIIHDNSNQKNTSVLVDVFLILSLISLLVALFNVHANSTFRVVTVLIILRVINVGVFTDYNIFEGSLTDPTFYYDSWWLRSFSGLLLDLILLLHFTRSILILLVKGRTIIELKRQSQLVKLLFLILISLLGFGNYKLLFDVIWSINTNTIYSFDVSENLSFSPLRLLLFLAVIVQSITFFLANHLFFLTSKHLKGKFTELIILPLVGLIAYALIPKFVFVIWLIWTGSWLVLYRANIYLVLYRLKYQSMGYLIFMAFFASSILTYANYENHEKDLSREKSKFASGVIIGNDVVGEYHLDELKQSILSDPFIRSRFLNELLAQQNIRLRIKTLMPIYLDKYEYRIHTYDEKGAPYGITQDSDLDFWRLNYATPANETGYESLYFQKSETGRNKYISIIPISFYENVLGHIVLELTQKKYTSSTVFPSLLVERNPFGSDQDFDYAIYRDNKMLTSQGNYEFELLLNKDQLASITDNRQGIELNGFQLKGFEMDDRNTLVVVSEVYPMWSVLANLSFSFLVFSLLIAVSYSTYRSFRPASSFSFTNRIQFYIGSSFVIPMILISIALLQVLNNSYKEEIENNYQKRARAVAENMAKSTSVFLQNDINRDQYLADLTSAAAFSQSDLIVYNLNGWLLGTNRSEVFNQHLLGRQINPKAINAIKNDKGQIAVFDETIGKLDYKTVYTGIYELESGRLIGILCIPFFDFKNHLQRQQREVFQSLMILIAIVLSLTLFVSQVNLSRITLPIKDLAIKLKQVNYLQEEIPQLTYHSKDEIGQLVSEFNNMVNELQESKKALVSIQKESAWKEIARQVAHEIKNPLTPMRLKIQQLKNKQTEGSREYENLDSLMVQVDALATIADSFSAFAKMPAPNNEPFDLSKVAGQCLSLFQTENVHVDSDIDPGIIVKADKKLISQIFNNLFLNAIQSYDDHSRQIIRLSLKTQEEKATLSIQDKGKGISAENRDKIFKPYFSTKKQGSGIGLALAKKGIEQANGSIWFESVEGKGSTFFISLPVYKG